MSTHIHPLDLTRTYLQITINDIDNIETHIPAINTFIDTALAKGNAKVLVHCHAGISRSASAIRAYLCHKNGWTAAEARKFLQGKKGKESQCESLRDIPQADRRTLWAGVEY
jgi:protein-tyrosine phosphatase